MQRPVPTGTFAGLWRRAVARRASAPFLVWEGVEGVTTEWSYEQFDAVVGEVAGGLRSRGVAAGSAVHLVLANSPAFVAVWLACTQLGAWIVPADPRAAAIEQAAQLRRTRPALTIGSVERAEPHRSGVRTAAELGVEVPSHQIDEADTTLRELRGPRFEPDTTPRPLDRAAVMFTSGTTSEPKGVVLTQANYHFAGEVMAAAAQLGPDDRQLVVLPLFHANAQYYSVASAISVGASVALVPAFSASRFAGQASRLGATHASLFAAPVRMILARGQGRVTGGRLRHVWCAQNLTAAQHGDITEVLGCSPRQLYGMTETLPAVLTRPVLDPTLRSMGVASLGCTVVVWDDERDAPAAPGVTGSLLVLGRPGYELFLSYLDDSASTAAAIRRHEADGSVWFDTGDRASVDDEGRFYFDGRAGEMLKVAGENVSALEVEAVLAEHPDVLEVAVVATPDPVRDEVPLAYVVLQGGAPTAQVAELPSWAASRLAPSKRPHAYRQVAELPRTSVGKIRKHLLAQTEVVREVGLDG